MADEQKFPIDKTDEWEARQDAKKHELERTPEDLKTRYKSCEEVMTLIERIADLQAKLEETQKRVF